MAVSLRCGLENTCRCCSQCQMALTALACSLRFPSMASQFPVVGACCVYHSVICMWLAHAYACACARIHVRACACVLMHAYSCTCLRVLANVFWHGCVGCKGTWEMNPAFSLHPAMVSPIQDFGDASLDGLFGHGSPQAVPVAAVDAGTATPDWVGCQGSPQEQQPRPRRLFPPQLLGNQRFHC